MLAVGGHRFVSGRRMSKLHSPVLRALLTALMAALPSCSGSEPETLCSTEQAIHGASSEARLSLGSAAAAIGALESAGGDVKCSGFVVAQGWVLAAAHCRDELSPLTHFATDDGRYRRAVSFEVAHAERDVLLVRLLDSDVGGPAPIPVWRSGINSEWLGREVLLAGYGEDEAAERGELRAVAEPIAEVTATTVTTDGGRLSGACRGDSGGPLLYRDGRGSLFALGVLSKGDTECKGLDVYTRVDDLAEWVEQVQEDAQALGCGGLSEAGQCERGVARYCRADQPVRDVCVAHQVCGWSVDQTGFRCVDEADDACLGAAAGGKCDGNDLLTCDAGRVERRSCGSCASCQIRPDGGAHCD